MLTLHSPRGVGGLGRTVSGCGTHLWAEWGIRGITRDRVLGSPRHSWGTRGKGGNWEAFRGLGPHLRALGDWDNTQGTGEQIGVPRGH